MTQPSPVRRPAVEHPIIPLTAPAARPVRLDLGGDAVGPTETRALGDASDGTGALDPGLPPSGHSPGAPADPTGDAEATAPPGSPPSRPEPRRTGLTRRGAKALPAAVPDGPLVERVGPRPRLPRRRERHHPRLRPVSGPTAHRDPRAKGSVHR
ncbi:hypothetical protein [Streptomyces sp. WMMC940]|uniref:hypothetical protein n=1 Tax=Streptomyces sp. WMMC940 TaxID=3015153 RepID=UPI0022B65CA0|nr:hypothetical protein [Streptomyces sp. WMMC940]MCZ7462234.1 hypothetical protein [Streptomyces sp. WMMC940]